MDISAKRDARRAENQNSLPFIKLLSFPNAELQYYLGRDSYLPGEEVVLAGKKLYYSLDVEEVTVGDIGVKLCDGTVNGIGGGSVTEKAVGLGIEVEELLCHSLKDIDSGVHIHTALMLTDSLSDLDKTACDACTCGGIVIYGLGGSAEVNSRKPIVAKVCDNVMRYALCGVEVSFLTGVDVGKNKAVYTPGLAARPGGSLTISLTAVGTDHLTSRSVMLNYMVDRAVGTKVIAHCHIRVIHRNLLKSVITDGLARPVKEGEVHETVDDGETRGLEAAPCSVP